MAERWVNPIQGEVEWVKDGLAYLNEDDDALYMTDPSGKEVKVAKAGIEPLSVESLRNRRREAEGPSVLPALGKMALRGAASATGMAVPALGALMAPLHLREFSLSPEGQSAVRGAKQVGQAATDLGAGIAEGVQRTVFPRSYAAAQEKAAAEKAKEEEAKAKADQEAQAAAARLAVPPTQPTTETASLKVRAPGMGMGRPAGPSKEEQEYRAALEAEQRALEEQARIGKARAAEELGYREEALKRDAEMDARLQQIQGQYQRDRAEAMERYQKLSASLEERESVDPGRFWATRTTGQKVMAGIGMLLGAMGAPASGGQNRGVQVIEDAINRDIELQQAQLAGLREDKRAALGAQLNLLGMMQGNFRDDVEATAATRARLWERAARQVEALGSKYPGVEALAAQQAAQLRQKGVENLSTLEQRRDERARGWASLRLQQASLQVDAMKAAMGGVAGQKLPAGQAEKLGELNAGIRIMDGLAKEYRSADGAWDAIFHALKVPGTDASKYADKRKTAAQLVGGILEGGKLTDPDFDRYYDMMPSPADSKERAAQKIANIREKLTTKRQAIEDALRAGGFAIGDFANPSEHSDLAARGGRPQ